MKIQSVLTASIFLAAAAMSLTAGISSLFGFNLPYGPVMIRCSIGLIGAGLISTTVFKIWNNMPRQDLDD